MKYAVQCPTLTQNKGCGLKRYFYRPHGHHCRFSQFNIRAAFQREDCASAIGRVSVHKGHVRCLAADLSDASFSASLIVKRPFCDSALGDTVEVLHMRPCRHAIFFMSALAGCPAAHIMSHMCAVVTPKDRSN
eukprot:840087-Amphidinium_carterae.1